ncbi:MAG: lysine--tRNA ligase [Armatimonadetes bacterium]|nr:lysine--tRNA ligase [Armatimonadota bacterium]
MSDVPEQVAVRMTKLARLQEEGRDPFRHTRYERTHLAAQVAEQFEALDGRTVRVCGRLMRVNEVGKLCFGDLVDGSGRLQLVARADHLPEESFREFIDLDLGDILGVQGEVFRTRRGEISVRIDEWVLLAKALRPLPEKWHGLQDVEKRFRQRYLDLLANPEVRETLQKRSAMLVAARRFLDERGFIEVETPVLQPLYGGAAARPFTTHHNALDIDLYLRIAPELYLKRLVVGNLERVYEVARCFRNEGISPRHNPEFTQIEAYWAYANYEDIMALTEGLVCAMAEAVNGGLQFVRNGVEIDLTPPWRRVPLLDALKEATGVDFASLETDEEARRACAGLELGDVAEATLTQLLDRAFDHYIKARTDQPTFVTDYPVAISPLAKRCDHDPTLAQRFEPVIAREELGNAFSELNDPLDQRRRFEEQAAQRLAGDEEAHPLDEDFIRALEYGLPPTGGLGVGIDRLLMVLRDADNLRETIYFPLLRPE